MQQPLPQLELSSTPVSATTAATAVQHYASPKSDSVASSPSMQPLVPNATWQINHSSMVLEASDMRPLEALETNDAITAMPRFERRQSDVLEPDLLPYPPTPTHPFRSIGNLTRTHPSQTIDHTESQPKSANDSGHLPHFDNTTNTEWSDALPPVAIIEMADVLGHRNSTVKSTDLTGSGNNGNEGFVKEMFRYFFLVYLPPLFSKYPIKYSFPRRLDFAIHAAVAFGISAYVTILLSPRLNFGSIYLLYVSAYFTIRDTVGGAFDMFDTVLKGQVTITICNVILTAIGVGNLPDVEKRVVNVLLGLVIAFYLGYYFTHVVGRRHTVATEGILLVVMATTPVDILTAVRFLYVTILGITIGLLLMMVPIPRFSSVELDARYPYGVSRLRKLFSISIHTFLCLNSVAPKLFLSRANTEMNHSLKNLTIMRKHRTSSNPEKLWMFQHWPLRADPLITAMSPYNLETLGDLIWNFSSVFSTLSQLRYTSFHSFFVGLLSEPLLRLDRAVSSYSLDLTRELPSRKELQSHCEVVESKWNELEAACQHLLTVYGDVRRKIHSYRLAKHEENRRNRTSLSAQSRDRMPHVLATCGRVSPILERECDDIGTPDGSSHVDSPGANSDDPENVNKYNIPWHTATESFQQGFFLFTILDLCQRMRPFYLNSNLNSHSSNHSLNQKITSSSASTLGAKINDYFQWIVSSYPLCDLIDFLKLFVSFVKHPKLDPNRAKGSAKFCIAIAIASIFSVIPSVANRFSNPAWIVFSAVMVTADTLGAFYLRCVLRVLGTCFGGVLGYLLLLAFGETYDSGLFPLLCTYVGICQYVGTNMKFKYLMDQCAITTMIVSLGYILTTQNLSKEDFALLRAEEIIIGVLISVLVQTFIWPVSAIQLLRNEMAVSLNLCNTGLQKCQEEWISIWSNPVLQKTETDSEPQLSSTQTNTSNGSSSDFLDLASLGLKVQGSITKQIDMIDQADLEPRLCLSPFPKLHYNFLLSTIRDMWRLISAMERALRQIRQSRTSLENNIATSLPNFHQFRQHVAELLNGMLRVLGGTIEQFTKGDRKMKEDESALLAFAAICTEVETIVLDFQEWMNELVLTQFASSNMAESIGSPTVVLAITSYSYIAMELAQFSILLGQTVRDFAKRRKPVIFDDGD